MDDEKKNEPKTGKLKKDRSTSTSFSKRASAQGGFKAQLTPDPTEMEVLMRKAAAEMMFTTPVGDVSRVPILYVDPLFDPILLLFPKENLAELNRRLRHYYTYHPYVRTAIDAHAEIAISDFDLRTPDPAITRFYQDQAEQLNLHKMMVQLGRDYYLLGEAIMYLNWDPYENRWNSYVQIPPESVDIVRTYISSDVLFYLRGDEELRKLLSSPKPEIKAILERLPEDYVTAMKTGKPYLLDSQRVIYFPRKPSEYALRGQSIVLSILKDLIYEDKLRILQLTFVDRLMHPIKIWRLGNKASETPWIPPKKMFEEFKMLLAQAASDPDFNIVTHPFVEFEMISQKDKIEDIIRHFEFVQKRILAGLFLTEAMVGGAPMQYSTQAVALKVVMHRYNTYRITLEKLLKERLFLPLAQKHEFIKKGAHPGDPDYYILPEFFWKKVLLYSERAEQELLLRLREKGEIPAEVIADVFGLDKETLKAKIQQEFGTVFDPVYRSAREAYYKTPENAQDLLKGKSLQESLQEKQLKEKPKPEKEKSSEEGLLSNLAVPPRVKAEEGGTIPVPKGEGPTAKVPTELPELPPIP